MDYYVYIWNTPEGIPYYVGEGRGCRFFRRRDIPRPLSKDLVQVFPCHSKDMCWAYEEFLIDFFGRICDGGTLMNKTFGGRYGRGRKCTEEECMERSRRMHEPTKFVSPDGVVVSVQNYSEHCRLHGLSNGNFCSVANGKKLSCHGWMLADPEARPLDRSIRRGITKLISPDGVVIEVSNLKKLADELGVYCAAFYSLANGKLHSAYGYRLAEPVKQLTPKKRDYRFDPLFIRSPEGVDYEVTNLSQFASLHDLSVEGLVCLAKGDIKSHRGWYLCGEGPPTQRCYKTNPITLINTDGEKVEVKNITHFAKMHSIPRSKVNDVIHKRIRSYKGWKLLDS